MPARSVATYPLIRCAGRGERTQWGEMVSPTVRSNTVGLTDSGGGMNECVGANVESSCAIGHGGGVNEHKGGE